MSVSEGYRDFVLEQLGRAVPALRARPMFGGVGLYSGPLFFALIDDDTLYFKVDDTTRPTYEARGMGPFRPSGPDGEVMGYYELPADALEDIEELTLWAERAVQVAAARARKRSTSRKRSQD